MKRCFAALALLAFPVSAIAAGSGPTTPVTVQTVRLQTLARTVTAYGRLEPNPQALRWLSTAFAGRVSNVFVTVGSSVGKGQKLAHISPTPKSLAAFESAKSNLAAAKAKLKQTQTLAQNGLATQSDLAAAKSAAESARAQLAALKHAGVSSLGETLRAKHAGVVTQLLVTSGQWVSAGARIAALAPAGALWVRLGLTPRQAVQVKHGAAVYLIPVFASGGRVTVKVSHVAGQANPTTGLVDAIVPVNAGDSGLFPGEWVTGIIVLGHIKLPTVPRSAVLKDNQGYYVFVVHNGKAHRLQVKPRVRARGLIGLTGIKSGAIVVTQGNFELSDGAAVRFAPQQAPPASSS